jgi:predicted nucleic acid-binding protein
VDSPPIAFLDANVLYPAPLRDWLIRLALADVYRARWSDAVHAEWMRNLLANRPDLQAAALRRTLALMQTALPGATVSGYEHLLALYPLPDPDDRHVLAAAVHGGATLLVTFNQADFPTDVLTPLGLEVIEPDEFAVRRYAADPSGVVRAARNQRAGLVTPPKTVAEYLAGLELNRLGRLADLLRAGHADEI